MVVTKSCFFPVVKKAYANNQQADRFVFSETLKCLAKAYLLLYNHERLLLNHANTPGFLAPRGEEFNPGPETRLDRSELLCNKVLLKYKGDRESF